MPAWFLVPDLQPRTNLATFLSCPIIVRADLYFQISSNSISIPIQKDRHMTRMCLSILIFLLNVLSLVEFQISQPDATETNENFRSHENWLQESDATDCHFMQGGHLSG